MNKVLSIIVPFFITISCFYVIITYGKGLPDFDIVAMARRVNVVVSDFEPVWQTSEFGSIVNTINEASSSLSTLFKSSNGFEFLEKIYNIISTPIKMTYSLIVGGAKMLINTILQVVGVFRAIFGV